MSALYNNEFCKAHALKGCCLNYQIVLCVTLVLWYKTNHFATYPLALLYQHIVRKSHILASVAWHLEYSVLLPPYRFVKPNFTHAKQNLDPVMFSCDTFAAIPANKQDMFCMKRVRTDHRQTTRTLLGTRSFQVYLGLW